MSCKHQFKSVDSALLYVGNEEKMIDSFQCMLCKKWYFIDRETHKRINFKGGYKGDEVENEGEDQIVVE